MKKLNMDNLMTELAKLELDGHMFLAPSDGKFFRYEVRGDYLIAFEIEPRVTKTYLVVKISDDKTIEKKELVHAVKYYEHDAIEYEYHRDLSTNTERTIFYNADGTVKDDEQLSFARRMCSDNLLLKKR
jgi:hypothetical protein